MSRLSELKSIIPVCVVVALPSEARLLCDTLRCRRLHDKHFSLYARPDASLFILVSGVGKLAMASAVAYFCGAYHANCVLLNFGIAGSQEFPVGELLACHKLSDASTHKNYYPDFSWRLALPSAQVLTRDSATGDYPGQGLVDMEATGFYASSQQFVVRENIRLLKLVSDNEVAQAKALDKFRVQALIESQLDNIVTAIEECADIAAAQHAYVNINYQQILAQCHFTQTQSHQLYELCRRYEAIFHDQQLAKKTQSLADAKTILAVISEQCASITWVAT